MTTENLYSIIANLNGCNFATITYKGKVNEIGKRECRALFGCEQIEKITEQKVNIGIDYENSVNNRLEKKGLDKDFESQPLAWGKWDIFPKIIEHKGGKYLRAYNIKGEKSITTYLINGVVVTDANTIATITEMVKAKKALQSAKTQEEKGLAKAEQTTLITKNFDDIIRLKVGGIVYAKG